MIDCIMRHPKRIISAGLIFLILIAAVLIFSSKKGDNEFENPDLDEIKKSGRLRVVTEKSRVGFILEEKTVDGFSYELVKAFADSMELELEINLENNMDSAISGVLKNKYDLIASNVPNTTAVNNRLNLSVPILISRQMLIQRIENDSSGTDSLITDHHMLADKKIHVVKGSPFKMRLENLSVEIADTIEIPELEFLSTEGLVKAVSEGKINYTICDELQARRWGREYPNIDFSVPIGFNQQFCWAVNKKSPKLLEALNLFLSDFMLTDDYWNMYRKYY